MCPTYSHYLQLMFEVHGLLPTNTDSHPAPINFPFSIPFIHIATNQYRQHNNNNPPKILFRNSRPEFPAPYSAHTDLGVESRSRPRTKRMCPPGVLARILRRGMRPLVG